MTEREMLEKRLEELKRRLETVKGEKCEVWTRVMGYHRPVSEFNKGKKSEFKERVYFEEDIALKRL
nr:anaerobic ribonucleoside-triphosphate reductase [Thermotomaculum hydrothermale]